MAATGPSPQYTQWPVAAVPQADVPHTAFSAVDEVRTIFVLGFPRDVKERELQNLLRWWPGYEASQMSFKGEQPVGFALFSTAAMAVAARDALQNLEFDPETKSVLQAEMAKKNLYVKKGMATDTVSMGQSTRMCTVGDHMPTSFVTSTTWGPQGYNALAAPYGSYGAFNAPAAQAVGQPVVQYFAHGGYAHVQNIKDNPPCNTLFIGNLGEATSESELRGIFSGQPGFRQMKVLKQGRSTDTSSAVVVHNSLQGALLSSSDRGGMRIQYSKNPFGKRKVLVGPGMQAPGVMPLGYINGWTGHQDNSLHSIHKPSTEQSTV